MNKSHLIGAICAFLFSFLTVSANAALLPRLETSPGSGVYQAYYDDQLKITWTADANINGIATWDDQVAWAAGLTIGGVSGWRLPSMDLNGDLIFENCLSATQEECLDNEFGHLFYYGAGTILGSGIESDSPNPFSNVQAGPYWSSTELFPGSTTAALDFFFDSSSPGQSVNLKNNPSLFAWAVRSGDVGVVPVPAAIWLFGSGFIGLLGLARRKR